MRIPVRWSVILPVLGLLCCGGVLTVAEGAWDVSIAAIGDYGRAGDPERTVADLVMSWSPELIITLGDNNYPDGMWDNIDANVGAYYADWIRPFNGNTTTDRVRFTANRFLPALGNHDWRSAEAVPNTDHPVQYRGDDTLPYVRYFKGVTPPGPSGFGRYYDFVRGPIHFICVDSHTREPDGVTPGTKQYEWVRGVLMNSTSPHRVVFFHHTPYTSYASHVSPWMRWPFVEWGATLIMSGHVHYYERLEVEGLTYLINGLGGTFGENGVVGPNRFSPYSQLIYNKTWGAQRIRANATTLEVTFISNATAGGQVVDRVVVPSRLPYADRPTPAPPVATIAAAPSETPTIVLLVLTIAVGLVLGIVFLVRRRNAAAAGEPTDATAQGLHVNDGLCEDGAAAPYAQQQQQQQQQGPVDTFEEGEHSVRPATSMDI